MPCDIMYGQTEALYLKKYKCYCEYFDEIKNRMVAAYAHAPQALGVAANRQKVFHNDDTVMRHFKVHASALQQLDWTLYHYKETQPCRLCYPVQPGWC